MHNVNDLEILPSYRSDHSTVVISLRINDFVKGKGLWTFNVSLLKDKAYINTVKNVLMIRKNNICYLYTIGSSLKIIPTMIRFNSQYHISYF